VHRPGTEDVADRRRQDVVRQNDHVGDLPFRDTALPALRELGIRGPHRVALNCLRDSDPFAGKPSARSRTLLRLASDGSVQPEHWIELLDEPVGPEGDACAGIYECANVVGDLATVAADARFGPSQVVDGVTGLHRRDDAELAKPRAIALANDLRVF